MYLLILFFFPVLVFYSYSICVTYECTVIIKGGGRLALVLNNKCSALAFKLPVVQFWLLNSTSMDPLNH